MIDDDPPRADAAVAPPAAGDNAETELQARIAEAEWLKQHYDEQLRAAFAQVAALQARLQNTQAAGPAISPAAAQLNATERAELATLRAEVRRLEAAECRYLDRIEELKEERARGS